MRQDILVTVPVRFTFSSGAFVAVEETAACYPQSSALSSPATGRTPKTFALQGDPSRSRHSSHPGAVLKYSLRQAVTSHGVFSCIPFPNRNIEKGLHFRESSICRQCRQIAKMVAKVRGAITVAKVTPCLTL
ncbi:hypothetical protein AVEN_205846-1 [Araneus ventricosus]|uniref:Uncharacterized protein n=1 Tax=Araneus ventricosus TaxID=182803 RepID=A0A4Y2GQP9_ARAVE|nr:hypothetical protein AVEN_101359-1 [Araneus ventricosus]GBM55182.1 hypothetical protein AVEN_205846-1 [Araneus ventricosus]